VGLQNWRTLFFEDERFRIDLRNLAQFALVFMSQCILLGFIIAALLDQKIKGEAIYRTIFIFPFAVSGVVTGGLERRCIPGINLILIPPG
jgi:glucose/mannose transport system permease protein